MYKGQQYTQEGNSSENATLITDRAAIIDNRDCHLQSTVRSTCTFIGCTLMMLETSHLQRALSSSARATNDNTFSLTPPPLRWAAVIFSSFLYQTISACGFPPRDRHASSTFWPRCTVSPSVQPSMYGGPGGSAKKIRQHVVVIRRLLR